MHHPPIPTCIILLSPHASSSLRFIPSFSGCNQRNNLLMVATKNTRNMQKGQLVELSEGDFQIACVARRLLSPLHVSPGRVENSRKRKFRRQRVQKKHKRMRCNMRQVKKKKKSAAAKQKQAVAKVLNAKCLYAFLLWGQDDNEEGVPRGTLLPNATVHCKRKAFGIITNMLFQLYRPIHWLKLYYEAKRKMRKMEMCTDISVTDAKKTSLKVTSYLEPNPPKRKMLAVQINLPFQPPEKHLSPEEMERIRKNDKAKKTIKQVTFALKTARENAALWESRYDANPGIHWNRQMRHHHFNVLVLEVMKQEKRAKGFHFFAVWLFSLPKTMGSSVSRLSIRWVAAKVVDYMFGLYRPFNWLQDLQKV